ncbi:hypothetical protein SCHPADRAFT_588277 [Schizopora paradoxa]|uniref:DUF6533 domain-containing protein n=1 Tax=Schizopora paradoxa TaxID=27342 RepID=A0A0H2RBV6_9AGAM|nr:hypothetical protein SCHPADRAFT_588277 [Schizopora paradoxa]
MDYFAELTKLLVQSQNVKYFYLSNASLLYYDTFINFDDEYQFIWKARWSVGKILYIMARYFAFVDVALLLVFTLQEHPDPTRCMHIYKTSAWLLVVGVLVAEALLIVRTYAIFERNTYVLAYLVCLKIGLTIPAIKILNDSFGQTTFLPSPAPTILPCFPDVGIGSCWPAFLCIAIFDLNILSLTTFNAVSQWSAGMGRSRLLKTLVMDGALYFVCLFASSVSNVVILRTQSQVREFLTESHTFK